MCQAIRLTCPRQGGVLEARTLIPRVSCPAGAASSFSPSFRPSSHPTCSYVFSSRVDVFSSQAWTGVVPSSLPSSCRPESPPPASSYTSPSCPYPYPTSPVAASRPSADPASSCPYPYLASPAAAYHPFGDPSSSHRAETVAPTRTLPSYTP